MTNFDTHDFQETLYDQLHASEMQEKFRELCPMPFGVVFLPWAGMKEEEMRQHFRWMRELGFTNLKQTMESPEWPRHRILEVALEEGIIPFWYGTGGYERPTATLKKKLGIAKNTPIDQVLQHPEYLRRQKEILWERIHRSVPDDLPVEGADVFNLEYAWEKSTIRLYNDPILREDAIPFFKNWVKDHYSTIEDLNRAWNLYEVGICERPYASWEDFEQDQNLSRFSRRNEYRHIRDILRFKADTTIARLREKASRHYAIDPEEPQRSGGEMGLFLPFAWRGTDMEGIAEVMREYGSFYPSIHLAWHFEEVHYEVARPVYMQASLAADWFKGGWSATWESTGGPQQFSGGKGWDMWSAAETAGFTVDEGTMTQLILSYLAGGFRGVGLWCWNPRMSGWEAGEYALCERNLRPGRRAQKVGKIARLANHWRRELWQARKKPLVGVFVNWDNEAIWAAISMANRDHFRHYPIHARVGISRILIDHNIPFEYVTASDLRNGLTRRYRILYLPAQVSINQDLWPIFERYVTEGGRLIMDAPGAWLDEKGRMLVHDEHALWTRLLGVRIVDYQYAQDRPWTVAGERLSGFTMELESQGARIIATFQENGLPAVTENRYGKGSTVCLAFEASHLYFRPRSSSRMPIVSWILGPHSSPYRCQEALVYRLSAPAADHYFLINDGPATIAHLETEWSYQKAEDLIEGKEIDWKLGISIPGWSATWIRCEK